MARPETPLLAVDIVIRRLGGHEVLLIERHHPPYGWATPGGFVDVGETVEAAARREAREETGLNVRLDRLLGVYSDPARDPRGHTVSVAFLAWAEEGEAVAGDDAKAVRWFDPRDRSLDLAFDGRRILDDALALGESAARPATAVTS